jgi:trimethylamine:corrinoid methyltransferase-like protein
VHCSFEDWDASGRRELFNEAREEVDRILRTHQPLPLDEDMERERERIQKKAQEKEGF